MTAVTKHRSILRPHELAATALFTFGLLFFLQHQHTLNYTAVHQLYLDNAESKHVYDTQRIDSISSAYHVSDDNLLLQYGECNQRFGTEYLKSFSQHYTNYCTANSTAALTCFSNDASGRIDSFCVGDAAIFEPENGTFTLNCELRDWTEDDRSKRIPTFDALPSYWYQTGPRPIFSQFVHLELEKLQRATNNTPDTVSFPVKREDNNQNLWHTLMEIMSLTWTVDILSMTKDENGHPYFTEADRALSQIVIVDELSDGPYYDLWTLFTGLPIRRITDVTQHVFSATKLVVPLPGGSNTFWQGDWKDISCGQSPLLHAFVRRVLSFYGISTHSEQAAKRLRLTQIVRKDKRRLLDSDAYFKAVERKYPNIDIQAVDYAAISLAEQIHISSSSDILVGVHGAGLTHGMFMPPNSTLVEILPSALDHHRFNNMAHFLGHQHLSTHAEPHESPGNNGDWQHDDVYLREDAFLRLIADAIAVTRAVRGLSAR